VGYGFTSPTRCVNGKAGWYYTGVTRGKRLVVLVGQPKAVAIAVRGIAGRRRWSKLREWMAVTATPVRYHLTSAA
jgi:hypothetical protein